MFCMRSSRKHRVQMKMVHRELKEKILQKQRKQCVLEELKKKAFMDEIQDRNHYLIRIGNADNFHNQNYHIWGFKNKFKSTVSKIKRGDILWFLANKGWGGIVQVAEFIGMYDRNIDVMGVHTYTNQQQNWEGDENDWNIQIHYLPIKNFNDDSEYSELKKISLQGVANIWNYHEKLKTLILDKFNIDLKMMYNQISYENFKKKSTCKYEYAVTGAYIKNYRLFMRNTS